MRYLGLDLGTKSLGVSITDKTNTLVSPLPSIFFEHEDYEYAKNKVLEIINKYDIKLVVLGLPKNMDGSMGFASTRSINFKKKLEDSGVIVELEDERLTTKSAEDIVHLSGGSIKSTKEKIDSISACIILESYLRRCSNDIKE